MAKRKLVRRRRPQEAHQQPRNRLAEIQGEIRDVQQQIEAKRRDVRVIRTPADLKAVEHSIAALTKQLGALLLAEAMQSSLEEPENRCKARSFTQGAGHTIKDQGRRDVTLWTACGQVEIRVTYFSRNCDRTKESC
jgi:DNA-binding FrmR family transcriptional regulator